MDALYRYGAAYGMGEEPPQTSGEPGQPAAKAPAAQPGFWASVSNISSDLISQGVKAAPALIQQKLMAKMATMTTPKKAKVKAAPMAPADADYGPTAPEKGLPGWVIPAAIGGAALVGVLLFVRARKKG